MDGENECNSDRLAKSRFVDDVSPRRTLIYRFYELVQTYGMN